MNTPPSDKPAGPAPIKIWSFWAGEQQKLEIIASGLDKFPISQWCMGADKKTGVALNEIGQRLCLLNVEEDMLHRRLFNFTDFLGSEIVEDGYVLASTMGAPVVARKSSEGTVKMVAFKLVLRAPQPIPAGAPDRVIHIVKFLAKESSRGSEAHKVALDRAEHWHRLVMAFLHIEGLRKNPLPTPAGG